MGRGTTEQERMQYAYAYGCVHKLYNHLISFEMRKYFGDKKGILKLPMAEIETFDALFDSI